MDTSKSTRTDQKAAKPSSKAAETQNLSQPWRDPEEHDAEDYRKMRERWRKRRENKEQKTAPSAENTPKR